MLEELYSQLKEFGVRVTKTPLVEKYILKDVTVTVQLGTDATTPIQITYGAKP
jgi:hypothetical protein